VNQTFEEMMAAIESFLKIVNSEEMLQSGRVVFFYFSGHGGKSNGKQELCPIPSRSNFSWFLSRKSDAQSKNVYLLDVIHKLDPTNADCRRRTKLSKDALTLRNTNIFVIDACRQDSINPANQISKDVDLPPATLVCFACLSGECALDGIEGRNGMFTESFLNSFQFGIQMSMHQLFAKTRNLYNSSANCCAPMYDTTCQDFTFQYSPAFFNQVQKIREEILTKETGSIWNTMNEVIKEAWNKCCQRFGFGGK
jgi:hypothetical protein